MTWILARAFLYVPPFISKILDFIYRTVLIFISIYFEWRDTENQQYSVLWLVVQNEICLSSSTRSIFCRVRAPSKDFSEELS